MNLIFLGTGNKAFMSTLSKIFSFKTLTALGGWGGNILPVSLFGLCFKKTGEGAPRLLSRALLSLLSFLFLAACGGDRKNVVITPPAPVPQAVPQSVVLFSKHCPGGGSVKITGRPPQSRPAVSPHSAGAPSVPVAQPHTVGAVPSGHYPLGPGAVSPRLPPGTAVVIEGVSPLGENHPPRVPCYREAVSFRCNGQVDYGGNFACRGPASLTPVPTSRPPAGQLAGFHIEVRAEAWIGVGQHYRFPSQIDFNGVMLYPGGAFVSISGITYRPDFGSPQRCPINFQC